MRTPEEHQQEVAALIAASKQVKGIDAEQVSLPLGEALGRVLVEDVHAPYDSPRFDNSQMDGYALSHAQATAGIAYVGEILPAGTEPAPLTQRAIPIMTGAKVPEGTFAIVPVEHTTPPRFLPPSERIEFSAPYPAGQFIRPRGCDIRAGQLLLRAGTTLTPVAIGVLASQDIREVIVRARHRVVICTGGAEVARPGASESTSAHGALISDANGPMLAALCQQAGIEVVAHIHTHDDPAALRTDLNSVVKALNPSAIITSGGISHGAFEVVKQVLSEAAAKGKPGQVGKVEEPGEVAEPKNCWFGHVAQQPGGPQGLATFQGVPVICLPGNPISTLVSFRLFVAPTLGAAADPITATIDLGATTTQALTGLPDKTQFLRGKLTYLPANTSTRPATPEVAILGGAGSHLLAQAAEANCLVRIPPGGLTPGAATPGAATPGAATPGAATAGNATLETEVTVYPL